MPGQTGAPGDPTERRPDRTTSANAGTTTGADTGMTGKVQDTAGRVVDKVRETASRMVGGVQETASPAVEQVEAKGTEVMDQAAEQVSSRLDLGKDYAAETLTGVAQALRQTGQHLRQDGAQPMLGDYADTGAEQLERLSGHLRSRDANELLAEVELFARRSPTLFAGGAFALGLLAARFFRSSGRVASSREAAPTSSGMAGMHAGAPASYQPPTTTTASASGRPSYPQSAPAARSFPATPDWTPPPPTGSSSTAGRGGIDTESDQLTPIPGSLPAPIRPTRSGGGTTPPRPESTGTAPEGPDAEHRPSGGQSPV